MRPIDEKELEKQTKEVFKENPVVMGMLLRWIRKQPTIDAVPVVRCKDCKHWEKKGFQGGDDVNHLEYGGHCPYSYGARFESDYCSLGEKKEADGNG